MSNVHDRRIAIHEAGHAVCALLLGRLWACCLCAPNEHNIGGLAGPGDLAPAADPTDDELRKHYPATDGAKALVEEAVLSASGFVAERLDAGDAYIGRLRHTAPDRAMIVAACRALLCGVSDDTTEAAFEDFVAAASRRLLGPHLESIRAVADALQLRRRLSAGEVGEIFKHIETRIQNEREN